MDDNDGVGGLRRIDDLLGRAGLPVLARSAWVEVDIDRLIDNARALTKLVSPAELGPVVKADGYGHGLEVAARCAVAGGATWLCVADTAEAIRLRDDGYEGRILVLYPVPDALVSEMARLGVHVTLGSVDQAKRLGAHRDADSPALRVHLEIDSGMTRGGVAPQDAGDAARAIIENEATELAGVSTHLAAPEDPFVTDSQLDTFDSVVEGLRREGRDPGVVHAAASGGLLARDDSRHDLVRPGLAYYGIHPGAGNPLPESVSPPLAVRAHAVRIADVPAGTRVGYAGTWTAARMSRIATLPIGYADGWSRASAPGSSVLVEGRRAPLVARVSSDSLTVDITDIDGVRPDSEFTLLGRSGEDEITADEIAKVRDTISWEVLQQLGSRLTRVYLSGSKPVALRAEFEIVPITVGEVPRYRTLSPPSPSRKIDGG